MTAVRRTMIAVGALTMGYAVLGALGDRDVKFGVLLFLAEVLVVHDGLLLPAVIGVGALIGGRPRTGDQATGGRAPTRVRMGVRVASLVSVCVTFVALPLVLGRGRSADNPSILPLPYGRGLLLTLAAVWILTAAVTAGVHLRRGGRCRRSRRGVDRRPGTPPGPPPAAPPP